MPKLSQILGLPDGFDAAAVQLEWARTAADWAATGRADELEVGTSDVFWYEVRRRLLHSRVMAGTEMALPVADAATSGLVGIDLRRIVRTLETCGMAFEEAHEDIAGLRGGREVYYNIDFSLLAPYLFDRPSEGSAGVLFELLPATRQSLEGGDYERSFQLVVSPYTVLEILDSVRHELDAIGKGMPWLYSAVDPDMLRESLVTSDGLRTELLRYTDRGMEANLRRPFERLSGLLESGVICGIGDVVDVNDLRREARRRPKTLFDQFLRQHQAARLPSETRRLRQHSEFHYRMDVGNALMTLATARIDGPTTFFVTPTYLNRKQCRTGELSLARWDSTPLIVRSATELRRAGTIEDEIAYTQQVANDAVAHAAALKGFSSVNDISPWRRQRVERFMLEDVRLSASADASGVSQPFEAEVDAIMEALASPGNIPIKLREAAEATREEARRLATYGEAFGFSYLEEHDLSDDPVLRRLQSQLGVNISPLGD